MESTDMDLDISWIKENERLQNMETNYLPELMENIDLFFIYINPNNYIDKIIREKYPLFVDCSTNCSRLSKEILLKIIQTNKKLLKSNTIHKYKFMDVLTYHIDLEPEHIQNYVSNENLLELGTKKLHSLSIIQDFVITPSIFIFHKINSLFFVFKQIEQVVREEEDIKLNLTPPPIMIQVPIKSILKNKSDGKYEAKSNGLAKATKKIRIYDTKPHVKHKSTTRKNISDIIT